MRTEMCLPNVAESRGFSGLSDEPLFMLCRRSTFKTCHDVVRPTDACKVIHTCLSFRCRTLISVPPLCVRVGDDGTRNRKYNMIYKITYLSHEKPLLFIQYSTLTVLITVPDADTALGSNQLVNVTYVQ